MSRPNPTPFAWPPAPIQLAAFDESKHPRDEDGKFSEAAQHTLDDFMGGGRARVTDHDEFGDFTRSLTADSVPLPNTMRDIGGGYQVGVAETPELSSTRGGVKKVFQEPEPRAVLMKDGEFVGVFVGDTIAISPDHRGKGLSKHLYRERMKLGPLADTTNFSKAGYAARKSFHKDEVRRAIGRGESVSADVLKDYPELDK